jgi:hypothetical protein
MAQNHGLYADGPGALWLGSSVPVLGLLCRNRASGLWRAVELSPEHAASLRCRGCA